MDFRFLGIAWPSPVTVDLLLCNMNLLYEHMSTETSIFIFEELSEPFSQTLLPFLSPCKYLVQQIYVQMWISIFAMFAV